MDFVGFSTLCWFLGKLVFQSKDFHFFVAGMMNGSTLSIRKHRLFLWTHAVSL